VIKVDLPNVISIALGGLLGYSVLVAVVKVYQMTKGQAGNS
jgi:hypothetical protein